MQIVEIGDCSMVIMKDSEDPPWVSVGKVYRHAVKCNQQIEVGLLGEYGEVAMMISSDMIYTAGRLVLFFKDPIDSVFHLHDRVQIF